MNDTPTLVPAKTLTGSDRLWSVLCHLCTFVGFAIVFPLIVYLVMRKDSTYVADHAREALNFHLTLLLYGVVAGILVFVGIGIVMLFALWLFSLIFSIIAAVKASDGIVYRYPLTIRLVS